MSVDKTAQIAIHGLTDIGLLRSENEDSIRWFQHTSLPFGYLIIADGMGGYAGGSTASRLAVNAIGDALEQQMHPTFLSCTPQQQTLMMKAKLLEAIHQGNENILFAKQENPQFNQMGTTLAITVIWQDQVSVAHLGDSRVYLWNQQGLTQLTKDHSIVQEMVDSGRLSEAQAQTDKMRNRITRALGIAPTTQAEINHYSLTQDSLLMLCSDGLTSYLNHDQINNILNDTFCTHHPIQECCSRLIDEANRLGGKDNISVGIIKYTLQ